MRPRYRHFASSSKARPIFLASARISIAPSGNALTNSRRPAASERPTRSTRRRPGSSCRVAVRPPPLCLAQPPGHRHVAKHSLGGVEMFDCLQRLAGAAMEAAQTKVALRDERPPAERLGAGERPPIEVAGTRDVRPL